jgi:cob(I)alamin adenosyltransferase
MKAKLYTGLGDGGKTGVIGSGRYSKAHRLFEALGSIEELSALLGIVKASISPAAEKELLTSVQRSLYRLMAQLSASQSRSSVVYFTMDELTLLETDIENLSKDIEMPGGFIIPGDSIPSAQMDLARAVSRRVERRVVELFAKNRPDQAHILAYVNRLSTLLFILELRLIQQSESQRITMAK